MNEIYVTGHRNPDTDSIVAALAYANLRNALGERTYRAVRIGSINDETQRLLSHFGVEAPPLVKNMRTQVRDLDFDHPPVLNGSVPMNLAWQTMTEQNQNVVPIVDDSSGMLLGMLSSGDLAAHDMETIYQNRIEDLPVFNLVSVLEGTLVNELKTRATAVSGELFITLPQNYEDPALVSPDSILICGDQPELIERALASGVNCLIICRSDIRPEWAEAERTCIISTPLSARRASRMIYQAIPVERVIRQKDIVSFHLNDYVDDVRETLLKSRYRSYPILDEKDRVVGTLSRYHLLRPRRKQVVLVDHNEAAQSVPGLEQVEFLEIIDHHRLADIQTGQPIQVRNEPVGSTNTILTAMYQEHGVVPTPKIAGLMAGAILSDTVMFKSPTCTKRDIAMAERLARIANVSLDELGKELFAAGSSDGKTAEELFKTDYKQFHISGQNIGVSQITSMESDRLLQRRDEFMAVMEQEKKANDYDLVILMITDVLQEGSYLLYVGSDEVIQQAFNVVPKDKQLFLRKVMSRKKQIIPMLTALWG